MTATITDDIEASREGGTLLLRFARSAKKNALTLAMYEQLNTQLAAAAVDREVKAVVLASTSENFTAGNDLRDFMQSPPTGEDAPVFRFVNLLATFEKPLLAAVDGRGVGVGLTMLLHCDFVYITARAQLSAPFVSLGLVPEAASSLLLPQLVGHRRAAELLLLGEPVSGERAVDLGLANEVVAPEALLPRALEVARLLGEKPPTALKLTKALMRDRAAAQARVKLEGQHFSAQLASPEVAEAIGAFFEKRKPDFSKL